MICIKPGFSLCRAYHKLEFATFLITPEGRVEKDAIKQNHAWRFQG